MKKSLKRKNRLIRFLLGFIGVTSCVILASCYGMPPGGFPTEEELQPAASVQADE